MNKISKKISILNSANVYAQSFLYNVRGFNRVQLGDLFTSRKSVRYSLLVFMEFESDKE